jgi:hypothetical protein
MALFKNTYCTIRFLAAVTTSCFDATIPLIVVAVIIDKHHTPQALKMEQLFVAVASLLVITYARDFLEQRFEKVLMSLEDQIDASQ